MQDDKLVQLMNKLKNTLEVGVHIRLPSNEQFIDFGEFTIRGSANILRFNKTIYLIWKNKTEIYNTTSKKSIRDKVVGFLEESIKSKSDFKSDDVKKIYDDLLSMPLEKWEIFRPLYGTSMSSEFPVKLGPFTIYDSIKHKSRIEQKHPRIKERGDYSGIINSGNLLVSIEIKARDADRAVNDADLKFAQFENIIAYMHGRRSKDFHISIFDHRGSTLSKVLATSSSTISSYLEDQSPSDYWIIDHPYFTDSTVGNDKIWTLMEKSNATDMEKRLLSAIGWLGKCINDLDNVIAFIKCMFAIESLLNSNPKGLITASVANKIVDRATFILCKNFHESKKLKKFLDHLYKERSAIAHGGKQDVNVNDLHQAFLIAKKLVIKIITDSELKNLGNIEDLQTCIEKKKFS